MKKKWIKGIYHLMVIVMVLLLPLSSINSFVTLSSVSAQDILRATGTVTGSNPGDNFGWNVTGVGDVNGDGFDDILVGAPKTDVNPKIWWDEDWAFRTKLMFDNSGQLEDLVNFVVLVTLDSSNFDYLKAKPDGSDIRFIDGTLELKYHIEKWNPSGESFIWVKVTSIDGGSSSDFIWMYYGNPTAANTQDQSETYDTNFMGVWHLNEAPGIHYDSTSNNNDGIPQGGITQDAQGKIAGADDFDGDSDYIDVSSSPSLSVTNQITIEAWVMPMGIDHTDSDLSVVSKFDNSDRAYHLGFNDDGGDSDDWDFRLSSDGTTSDGQIHVSNSVDNNQWQYVTGTWDGADVRLYKNGVQIGSAVSFSGPIHVSTADVWIGEGTYYGSMDGIIDEVRISNLARSADWIAASYLSMNNNFITFIPEEINTWWNSDWQFRNSLTFDNSGQVDTLKNFPVLVTLNSTNFDYLKAKSDGSDLRFLDGTNELNYHIEKWNASGDSYVWVNVSSILAGSSSDYIWMYYGNPAAANTQDISGTYDTNFMGVWHLNETSGSPMDATSYSNHGTIYNNVQMDLVGKVDGAADFEGDLADDDYIDCGNDPSLEFDASKDYTWSAWIYRHANSDWDVIFSKFSWTNYGIRVFVNTGGAPKIVVGNHQNDFVTTINSINLNTWYYITMVYNSTLPMLPAIYINGEREGTIGVATFLSDFSTPFDIGYGVNDEGWDGELDEIRFSNTARSDSWIKAQFLSMNNNFITFGGEEGLQKDAGAAYLFFGYSGMSRNEISADLANVTIYGSAEDDLFGWSVSSAGNQNGDEYDDFIIGAPGYKNQKGRAYIFYGKDTSSWNRVSYADFDADIILTGENEGDRFGHSVSDVGNVNRENNFDSWMFRKKITILASQVTADLTDFPVVFQAIDLDLVNGARPDGLDIVFTGNDEMTVLDFEIEYYNSTTGALIAWIKIPFLSSSQNTEIFMYYGNPSSSDLSNPQGVWDTNYMGVWHLSELGDGSVDEFKDSSLFDNNGQGGSGSLNHVPTQYKGKIGFGQDFDGIDDHINCATSPSLDVNGNEITMELWLKWRDGVDDLRGPLSYNGWDSGYRLIMNEPWPSVDFHLPGDSYNLQPNLEISPDTWYHVAAVYNGSKMYIYFNGSKDPIEMVKTINVESPSSAELWIGHGDDDVLQSWSYPWNGSLDEVRISNVARSSDWIKTEYNNQNNSSAFFLIGSEEIIDSNWLYKKQIIIDSAKVSADLFDFPVLIKTIDADLMNHARPDGFDIIFTSADQKTKLDHEIEMYNGISGELIAWVKIPFLSSGADTVIYMHYGNTLSFNHQDVQGTWSNGYLGVYHMMEETGNIDNSASSSFDGTRVNTPTRASGQIGYGQEFTGSGAGDMFDLGNLGFSDGVKENITISVWANINDSALGIWSRIINKRDDSDSNTLWSIHFDSQPVDKDLVFAAAADTGAWPIAKSTWVYITMTYNGLLKTHYHNGTFMRDDNGGSGPISIPSSAPVTIGARQGPTQDFGGIMDEMRISYVSRSAQWVLTQYNNQNDPGSFMHLGNEEISLEEWSYRKPMTIHSSKVTGDLTNFPVLVSIIDSDLQNFIRPDGNDIVFTLSDGLTRLDHEIENYSSSSGKLVAWVRIPNLSSSSDTKIFMYYGKSSQITTMENPQGVWDSNYMAVWHLNEDGNGTQDEYDESTINDHDGRGGSGDSNKVPTRISAKIDSGQIFDGSNDFINVSSINPQTYNDFTIEAWYKSSGTSTLDDEYIWSHLGDYATGPGIILSATDDPGYEDRLRVNCYNDTLDYSFYYGTSDIVDQQYHYLVGVRGGGDIKVYVDANEESKSSEVHLGQTYNVDNSSNPNIGDYPGHMEQVKGILDEIRISKSPRSWDWINATYNNQNSPSTFITMGMGEGLGGFDDVIVGAPGFSNDKGRVYLFLGSPSLSGEFSAGSAEVIFNGTSDGDRLGEDVSGKGNINQAGYHDIIIGAPGALGNDGAVYVIYGIDPMPSFLEAVNSDIVIVGSGGYEFGSAISNSVDVNSDGFDDIIVGSPKNNGGTGAAFVFYGSGSMTASMNIMDADVMMFGESSGDEFGYSIQGIDDINGDGIVDLAIGAPNYDDGAKSNCGAIYIYEGGSPMDGISDWIVKGENANDHFGMTNSFAGDINGDTLKYILAGAPFNDEGGSESGKVYIITASIKPVISNVQISPLNQVVGGNVNISCTVATVQGVDTVWINVTFPDGSFQNISMDPAALNNWYMDQMYNQIGTYEIVIWANNSLSDWSQSTTFQFNVINQVHTLTIPQVNPTSGYMDSSFNYTVIFTDLDNQSPDTITVNISGLGAFDLLQSDPLDLDYSDGKTYYLELAGFSIGQYSFHFAANDSTGYWVESANRQFDVINRAPSLSSASVTPGSGFNDDSFNFTVIYRDLDDHAPGKITVNITGFGTFDLLQSNPADANFIDGKSYYYIATGFTQNQYQFKFAANDSLGQWVETALIQLNVINRAPSLSFETVFPTTGYTKDKFNFTVTYFDLDNNAPFIITVNITNLGVFDLFEVDSSDTDFIDGKEYYFNTSLTYGSYSFHFAASDVFGLWAFETPEIPSPVVSPRPGVLDIEDYTREYGDPIYLNATLFDNIGNPISDENVSFYIDFNSDGIYSPQELVGTELSSPSGDISLTYPGLISIGNFNYSAVYFGSGDYIVSEDYASITIIPKPATLTADIVAVEAGQNAFLNASLLDNSGNPIINEYVALYIDKNNNGLYEPSELVVWVQTNVNGIASLYLYINLPPENYGFRAKYEGSGNYNVTDIKGLITVMSTGNIPPTITEKVPDQIKLEDSPPWTLDLTPYEDDIEDPGADLKWYLEGEDTSLYKVTGENTTEDDLKFILEPDAFGNDEVVLWLYDSEGSWDSQVLWINITPDNDIPYFDPLPPNLIVHYDDPTNPDDDPTPFDYTFYVHDIETPTEDLVITTSQPTTDLGEGYAEVNGLSVTFHYPEKRVGDAILVFLTLSDGEDSSQTMIIVTVTDEWVPELSNKLPDIVLNENSTRYSVFDLDDFFSDKDNDVIYFSSGNNNIIVHINENHTVDITAPGQWTGTELVTFRARDPSGAIVEDLITVTVLPVNDGPKISKVPDLVVHYDYSYSFDLTPYINDPDNLTSDLLVWTSEPLNYIDVQANNNLGLLVYYPESFDGQVIPVTIYVSDGLELDSFMINISVTSDFPPELIQNLPDVYFDEDSILENAFTLSDYFFDIDSQILYYTNGTKMINVTINNDLSVDFSAPKNWFGSELVTFRATDSQGALAEDMILVIVTPVNDQPVIESIPWQEKNSGDEWVLDLTGYISDIDNKQSELTISINSENAKGYVTLVGQVLIFKYQPNVKDDYVTVTVSDGELETSRGFIVSLKNKEKMAPSIWDLIPWSWVLSTMFVALILGYAIYRKKTSYKVYEAFLIHEKGLSVAHASQNERSELEEVIVSGMFTAVQDFIGDTFSDKTSEEWELDEMKFGENKILIERSKKLFLAVIFEGNGDRLRTRVKRLLGEINSEYGAVFENWKGEMTQVRGINFLLMGIISKKMAKKHKSEVLLPTENQDIVEVETHDNLTELDEIIQWSENLSKGKENMTESGEIVENIDTIERYECPICGVEVEDGVIFCPVCKSKASDFDN
jgi:hypothetical protein